MPIGLNNVPITFMKTMNNLFIDILDKGVVFFLNKILIYSIIMKEHFELLEMVFAYTCVSKSFTAS